MEHDFLAYSPSEKQELKNMEDCFKKDKLMSFYSYLINKNDFSTIHQLLNNQIKFYKDIDTADTLNESIGRIAESIFKHETGVANIMNITDSNDHFIKDIFMKQLVRILSFIEKEPIGNEFPFHSQIIHTSQTLLLQNPEYIALVEDITLPSIECAKRVAKLNQELETKEDANRKMKI